MGQSAEGGGGGRACLGGCIAVSQLVRCKWYVQCIFLWIFLREALAGANAHYSDHISCGGIFVCPFKRAIKEPLT